MTSARRGPERATAPAPAAARPGSVAVRLAVTAVLLWLLAIGAGLLVTRVEEGSELQEVDTAAVTWLVEQRSGALNDLSAPAAELGNTGVVVGVGLAAALVALMVWRRWRPVVVLAVLLVGELAIFLATTAVIDRPRPPVAHLDAVLPPTSSFPSGHTAAAVCLYGGLAGLVLAATRAWWRWLVLALAVAVVLLVALARLYRGAHFPTDVLGSLLFAVPWVVVTLRLLWSPRPADP